MAELIESTTRKPLLIDAKDMIDLICEKMNMISTTDIVPRLDLFINMAVNSASTRDPSNAVAIRAKLIDLFPATGIEVISELHSAITILALQISHIYNVTNTRSPSGIAMYTLDYIMNDNTLVLQPHKYLPDY